MEGLMPMGKYLFLLSTFIIYSTQAANLYHRQLNGYPRGTGCEVTVEDLSKRFSQATGVEIYWAGVTKENSETCDIKISYISEKELDYISTLDLPGMGALSKGSHRKLSDCESDLTREVNLFKKSTGLTPWVSYCYEEKKYQDEFPFIVVIEAAGKPALNFFSSDTSMSITPSLGWPKTLASFIKTIGEQKISVASIDVRSSFSISNRLTIRLYEKERKHLRFDGIADHKDPSICDKQIDEVKLGLSKAKNPPIGVFCGKYSQEMYQLGIVSLQSDILEGSNLRFNEDPKQFNSLESCQADIRPTLEFYRTKLQKDALSGICVNGSGQFRITVIEEKKK
jgi:hypothetical protein